MTYKTVVTVIIDDKVRDNEIDFAILNNLQEFGLKIENVQHDEGVIYGIIDNAKVHDLKHQVGVSCVRESMTYQCTVEQ